MSRPLRLPYATLALVAGVVLLTGIALRTYSHVSHFEDRSRLVGHTHEVIAAIQSVLAATTAAEAAQRGYVTSGDGSFLDTYDEAVRSLPRGLAALSDLIADNPEQQREAARLRARIAEKLETLAAGVALRKRSTPDDPELLVALKAGKPGMDALRNQALAMQQTERTLLDEREAEAEASARALERTLLLGTAMALLLVIASVVSLRREVRGRIHAQAAIDRKASEIEDLYNNAPCGYHSVDASGIVVRINDTQLNWLGYRRDEVVGKLAHPDLMTAESAARFHSEVFPLFLAQGWLKDVEFDYLRKDGTVLPGLLNATTIYDEAGNYVMSRTTLYDITDRRVADHRIRDLNAQLAANAERLQAAYKELEGFSYSVSHDLRAPLRAIDGYSRMVDEDFGPALDPEARRMLGVVRSNTQRMGQLIDDLLEFSRLGRLSLSVGNVDMHELAGEVVTALQGDDIPAAAEVTLNPLPPTTGDRTLLKQVWVNLIANAAKYSGKRSRPRIEIGGEAAAGEMRYWVRDNGVGFDMRYYNKLFGVFQRLHSADQFPGTGVGLALVQRVVTRHGGKVWAEGVLDQGAVFFFSIPERTPHG